MFGAGIFGSTVPPSIFMKSRKVPRKPAKPAKPVKKRASKKKKVV